MEGGEAPPRTGQSGARRVCQGPILETRSCVWDLCVHFFVYRLSTAVVLVLDFVFFLQLFVKLAHAPYYDQYKPGSLVVSIL